MPETIQRSFVGGEISPALRSRADLTKYSSGLALCENMFPRSQGGAYSRPGTRFIGELFDSLKRARLIPFSFNTDQTYILVFEDLKIRVIRDGGYVLDGGGPAIYEIATPYTESQLSRLGFTQSADVMTIVHPDHSVMNLSRTADDAWSLDAVDYTPSIDPPDWIVTNTKTITAITQANPAVVTTSADHGLTTDDTITITDVVGMFEVNDRVFGIVVLTNTTFILKNEDSTGHTAYVSDGTMTRDGLTAIGDGAGDFDKTYSYVLTTVSEDGNESIASAVQSLTTPSLSATATIRLEWQSVVDAAYYRIYKDPSNGTGVYGWIGNSETNQFDDYNIAPITSDAPPEDRDPFAGDDNNPSAVNFYQQRQVFANTTNERQTVYTTQVGNFTSLRTSTPARADDAVTFTIAGREVNEIRHIVEVDAMILLTSGGEWKATEGQDEVLTPSTIGVRKQSNNGASWVPPVVVNDTVIYVQEKGARVRDLNYEFANDRFRGNDLSIMAEHLFENYQVEEMAYADEPYGIVWAVRNDGRLLGLTYQREHQIWAWHQHVTDGLFESVATITEQGRDAVYVIVNRTIRGFTRRYVERFEKRMVTSAADTFCVDSGLTYDGPPVTEISGLDHLEGELLAVVADGNVVEDLTVLGGMVTLPRAAEKVSAGLAYTPAMETLDVDVGSIAESLKAKEISIAKVTIEVESSRGGWVGPKADDGTSTVTEIKPRYQGDNYDTIALKTFKQEVIIDPQWNLGGGIRIEQRAPMPLAILAVVPEVSVG